MSNILEAPVVAFMTLSESVGGHVCAVAPAWKEPEDAQLSASLSLRGRVGA